MWWIDIIPPKVRPNNKRQPKVYGFHRDEITYPHHTINGRGVVGRLIKTRKTRK